MVGSFSFSVRLPFPMVSFFGYWGAFSFPSGFDGWFFRFRPRFLRSGSSFASFRLDGGLRDSLFVLRSGWSSVFPLFLLALRFLRQVVRSSFSVFSDGSCLSFVSFFILSFSLLFFLSSFPFSSFRSRLRLFPFSLFLDPSCLALISFVVFGFLSASLHRDAPSGGGVGRAAWPRMEASAVRRESLIHVSIEHRVDAITSHVGEDPVRVPVRHEPDGVPDAPRGLRVDAIVVAGDDAIEDPAARVDRKMKTCPALQRWGLARDA